MMEATDCADNAGPVIGVCPQRSIGVNSGPDCFPQATVPVPVGANPFGVAITPNGTRAYVANGGGNSVSVIDTATNTMIGNPIPIGTNPRGIAITPNGTRAYVTNGGDNTMSVISINSGCTGSLCSSGSSWTASSWTGSFGS
ncbi:YncE family protein [Rhodococcus erythropolis]|uniref:YncE family protein n=1 Tax=Rhodococcus erythropolis TaxID=1833 RepID=UPI0029498F15|nr:YncE family protein [Rhodococcus erythropolis]MDV6278311.1 YncE family protein [Rhodococcus erythropolis]